MDYFNLQNNEFPSIPLTPSRGTKPDLVEAVGLGIIRGAKNIAAGAIIGAGGLASLVDQGLGDDMFSTAESLIESKKKYTPNPELVSTAHKVVGGISELLPSLAFGELAPLVIINTATNVTGAELVQQGVDAKTATGLGILSGATAGAMVAIPAAGQTVAKTALLALLNPVIGAAETAAHKKALEATGNADIAKNIDIFDPASRMTDLVMGVVFGGMGLYAKARAKMPTEVNDAIDTATQGQHVTKMDIIGGENRVLHEQNLEAAIQDLTAGRRFNFRGLGTADVPGSLDKLKINLETENQSLIALQQRKNIKKTTSKNKKRLDKDIKAQKDVVDRLESTVDVIENGLTLRQLQPSADAQLIRDTVTQDKQVDAFVSEEAQRLVEVDAEVGTHTITQEGDPTVWFDGEKPVEGRTEVFANELERLSADVDELITNNPDVQVVDGFDKTGNLELKKASEVIEQAKSEVKSKKEQKTLYEAAVECLTR